MDPPSFTLLSNKGQSEIIKKNMFLTFQWLCYKQFLRLGQNLPLSYSLLYIVRPYCIQCEKKIRVQFLIWFNLVWKLVCNFMSLENKWSKNKFVRNFTSLDTKWGKKKTKKTTTRTCNFTLPLQALGPIGYDCYRSLWNKLEKKVLEISN